MNSVKLRGGRTAARIALAGLLVTLTGCQTLNADRNTRERESSGLLYGSIKADVQVQGPFVVEAIDRERGTIAHRVFIEKEGAFRMHIDAGAYKFIAFADHDRDGRFDRSEPVSIRMALDSPIRAGDVIELPSLDIRAQSTASR
jgi:hypothetical protein